MSIIEVRLFELQLKGERLDELNAEEVLEQRAAAQAKARARRLFFRHLSQQVGSWSVRLRQLIIAPARVGVK